MQVPFLDLHLQYQQIKPEIDQAIKRVVDRQHFILGDESLQFENEFASYLQVKHVVGVNSGTDGLILALRALGIGAGDEVITPANSFIATALAIVEVGATPVFVDIDPATHQIAIQAVEKNITKKTKLILPVHLYGAPCDLSALQKIATANKLFLVEDACQAHGAEASGHKVGTFGDIGVFSFYPGKNLGAYGDAGACVTNNTELFDKLQLLRNYGQRKKYFHEVFGLNSRLDELQAAVLRVKLKYLDEWNQKRTIVAQKYKEGLVKKTYQRIISDTYSNYHLFVIEDAKRDELMAKLHDNGVQTLIHYPVPIHLQKCFAYLDLKPGSFPHAEAAAKKLLSLPLYPELSNDKQEYIIDIINRFAA